MAASASASASAPALALTRVELVNKTQLDWLLIQVKTYVDEAWRPQVAGALHRCIEAYDDDQGGYTVEYHQKTYGGKAIGRLWDLLQNAESLLSTSRSRGSSPTLWGL